MNNGRGPGKIVGVFRDRAAAERAAQRVEQEVTGLRVNIDRHQDEVTSLRAEMRDEAEHTIIGPGSIGPFTKEMTKGILGGVAVWTILGMLLAFPVSFIRIGTLGYGMRLLIVLFCGAFAGATLGFVFGGGYAQREKVGEQMAAEEGVVLSVEGDVVSLDRAAQVLAAEEPIRLDAVAADGAPVAALSTEDDSAR